MKTPMHSVFILQSNNSINFRHFPELTPLVHLVSIQSLNPVEKFDINQTRRRIEQI